MITKPKGTRDLYGNDAKKWQYVSEVFDALCEKYNYGLIRTPIFEASELFHRSIGETTDVVSKETYDFIDRGDRNMTLRPEGTAGVIRSYIENKMFGDVVQPIKFYYNETMYRYERPQSGRMRELTQFGVEIIGSADPYADAEIISIPVNFYKLLGLQGIKVNINTLGDSESRQMYRDALIDYLKPHINDLCSDCQRRFETNPLRIIDCKYDIKANKEILMKMPKTIDYLNQESKTYFNQVKDYLDTLEIDYEVDPKIVRGLDYYTHTVFEIVAQIEDFGAQNVLCGGGRYDNLIEVLNGPSTPGVGFAGGFDRLMLALDAENINLPIKTSIDICVIYANSKDKEYAVSLTQNLRLNGFITELDLMNRAIKGQFKHADRLNPKYLVIVNNEDIKNGEIQVKDNATKEEQKISWNNIIEFFDMNI